MVGSIQDSQVGKLLAKGGRQLPMGPQAQELGDQATFLSLCTFCQGLALPFFKLQLVTSQSFSLGEVHDLKHPLVKGFLCSFDKDLLLSRTTSFLLMVLPFAKGKRFLTKLSQKAADIYLHFS